MDIIPPFVRSYILAYWQPLLAWFSELTYANLLPRADDHLLHRLQTHLDFQPLVQACVAFHHQTGAGAPPTHPVPRLPPGCTPNSPHARISRPHNSAP